MGEILRAVLDQSCTYSNPAFYTAEVNTISQNKATSIFECKEDTIFLLMAFSPYSMLADGTARVSQILLNSRLQITFPKSSRKIFSEPMLPQLIGQNNIRQFTLPEYIMIDKNEIIQWDMDIPVVAENRIYGLHYIGIEYKK